MRSVKLRRSDVSVDAFTGVESDDEDNGIGISSRLISGSASDEGADSDSHTLSSPIVPSTAATLPTASSRPPGRPGRRERIWGMLKDRGLQLMVCVQVGTTCQMVRQVQAIY